MKKKQDVGFHLSEEILEEYAFGRMSEPALGQVEEHLLVCEPCQDALRDVDEYILLMKTACSQPLPEARRRHSVLRYAAAAALAAGIAITVMLARPSPALPPEPVELVSLRGAETAQIHAGRPGDLRIDLGDLPNAEYRVELVDSAGKAVWSGRASAAAGRLRVTEPESLKQGIYWVRLYSAAGTLVREFGVEAVAPWTRVGK